MARFPLPGGFSDLGTPRMQHLSPKAPESVWELRLSLALKFSKRILTTTFTLRVLLYLCLGLLADCPFLLHQQPAFTLPFQPLLSTGCQVEHITLITLLSTLQTSTPALTFLRDFLLILRERLGRCAHHNSQMKLGGHVTELYPI